MDYDPSKDLEKIKARLLAINFADDAVNPPELDVLAPAIKRIANAKYVIVPAGPQTRGHFSHLNAALWKQHLIEFLKELPPRQM
jgi:homoserine O-acetyltransferase